VPVELSPLLPLRPMDDDSTPQRPWRCCSISARPLRASRAGLASGETTPLTRPRSWQGAGSCCRNSVGGVLGLEQRRPWLEPDPGAEAGRISAEILEPDQRNALTVRAKSNTSSTVDISHRVI